MVGGEIGLASNGGGAFASAVDGCVGAALIVTVPCPITAGGGTFTVEWVGVNRDGGGGRFTVTMWVEGGCLVSTGLNCGGALDVCSDIGA